MTTMTLNPGQTRVLPQTRPGQLRLTRRGRFVVVAAGLLIVMILGAFWASGSVATETPGTPPVTETLMVAPGDTLWSIASAITPAGDDVRDTMYDIRRLNRLETASLDAGQRLRVPVVG